MTNQTLLSLYHRSPYLCRVLAASGRGYFLASWRYGKDTERWVEEALDRESWSGKQWEAYQDEQLGKLLTHAATKVPYYRIQWQHRRRSGDKSSWEILENWPLLSKATVSENVQALVAEGLDIGNMYEEHTSGTTGTPLQLWFEKETVRRWFALFEARTRRWQQVSRKDRWGIFGGQLVAPPLQHKPPFWVWNAGLRQLYLSSYHIRVETVSAYIQAITRHGLVYLLGYASAIYSIAKFGLELELKPPELKVIFSNAEPLYEYQRGVIEQFFGCQIRDTYGMAELVTAASECQHGNMHLWPDVGVTEIMSLTDDPLPPGHFGQFVATGLLNMAMPLVRYESGDSGTLASLKTVCLCGRGLPIIESIEGRTDDMVVTADGRHIGRLDPIFKATLPIREAQIIQESHEKLVIKVVPAPAYSAQTSQELIRLVQQYIGIIDVQVDIVDSIPRTKNGKFRAVISHVS